jgi:4-hydroxy 2-oxovalerate aldolase
MARPVILDCTIRDGSYAIDFKFTARDSALVAAELDRAGVRWIEVGHGLGLGAAAAGKGRSTDDDLAQVAEAAAAVKDAKIGVFFIPGIGSEDDMRAAADAGLHFIRVGANADEIEQAFPYVDLARELGLDAFVNLMKTYGIAPEAFAEAAEGAHAHGAHGVYVVDSAGGMMPAEVAGYMQAAAGTGIELGFHGHSNLHLAVANSVAAYEAGATFIDTSVYGIGRSSGNVPTEVMAVVFERLGVDCGVDPIEIVELAETYLRPLAEHLHPHDMIAVSLGYGRFHSSYLNRALAAAEASGVSPFRLIVELGRRDMMRLPQELLDETVADLAGRPAPQVRPDLAHFDDPRFGPDRIGNRPGAAAELIDALEVTAAKRHLDVVLDLVSAPALDEEVVTAEFVLEDHFMALGRLRFGSLDALEEALEGIAGRIAAGLLDTDSLEPAQRLDAAARVRTLLAGRVVPYRSAALELELLGDVALAAISRAGAQRFLLRDPGQYPAGDVAALRTRLASVAEPAAEGEADIVVVAGAVRGTRGGASPPALGFGETDAEGAVVLRRADAYRDRLPRWRLALARADAGRLLH